MNKEITNSMAHANSCAAMETRDHLKNGVSPKSQRSRVNFLIICVLALIFCGVGNKAVGQTWNIGHNSVPGGNYLSTVTATLNGNTLTIAGNGNMADFWRTGVNQYDTGGEAPWWFNPAHRNAIQTVIFQNGSNVQNIGERAFKDCSNLQMIEIPNSVIKINAQSFYNCISLGNITLHDCITTVGGGAFHGCNILTVNNRKINPLAFDYVNDNEYPFNGIYKLRVMPLRYNTYFSNEYLMEILYDEVLEIPTYEQQSIGGACNYYNCVSANVYVFKMSLTEGVIYNFTSWDYLIVSAYLYNNSGVLKKSLEGSFGLSFNYQSDFTGDAYLMIVGCPYSGPPPTITYTGILSTPTGVTATQSGNSISISWNSVLGATSYVVYRSSSSSGTYTEIGAISGTSFSDTSPLCGANYYRIEAHNSSTKSNLSNSAYVNFPVPSQPGTINGSDAVCVGGDQQTYSISSVSGATSYTWTLPSGWSGSSTTTSITATPETNAQSGNITVKANNNCGSSATRTKYVTVNSAPSQPGNINGSDAACAGGSSQTYSISSVSGSVSYTWTLPSGWSGSSTTTSITATPGTNAQSGDITVKANNNCGSSLSRIKYVVVNSAPSQPDNINGSDAVCAGGGQQIYSISPVSGATSYTWTLPSGWSGNSTTTSITAISGTNAQSGNITVKASNNCGSSATRTKHVTVNSAPSTPGNIDGSDAVCAGGAQQTYSISPVSGATSYTWTLPNGWNGSGSSTTTSITATPEANAQSGHIAVKANNNCGSSSFRTKYVTVSTPPSAPTEINGTTDINLGESTTLTAFGGNEGSGCQYQWGIGTCGNNIISNQTGISIIVTPTITTTYWVRRVGNSPCNETTTACAIKSVTVNTVGINENIANQLQIFPNPTTDQLWISNYDFQNEDYRIYSTIGQVLMQGKLQGETTIINVASLANGIYYLRIGNETVKFMKE